MISGMVSGAFAGAAMSMSGNPTFCFVAGTTVFTTLGKKAIETIQAGDTISCVDHITGETAEKKVISTSVNKVSRLIELDIDGEIIQCTETHPFQVKGKGWVDAADIKPYDLVYTKDWNTATVKSVNLLELDESVEVFNFEVEDCHTYFVGELGILAHNGGCTEASRKGIQKHKEWNYGEGVRKEVKIGPGARVDGLDEVNKIVYELKPNNVNAINRGLRQLDRYLSILGDDWIGILLTY